MDLTPSDAEVLMVTCELVDFFFRVLGGGSSFLLLVFAKEQDMQQSP